MWHRCETQEDIKQLFNKLAFRLHPDQGGSNELFILLNESYEYMKNNPKLLKEIFAFNEALKKNNKFHENPGKYPQVFSDIQRGDPLLEILNDMFQYAENHKNFDSSFLESVYDFYERKGYVTSGQFNSLAKVYYSFRMNEKE